MFDISSLDISGLLVGSSQEESEEDKDDKSDTKAEEVGRDGKDKHQSTIWLWDLSGMGTLVALRQ